MNKAQAINSFWNSFGVSAYDENTVPDSPTFPYITYEYSESSFLNSITLTASIWDRSMSWQRVTEISESISQAIGRGGKQIAFDDGYIWITKGLPFAQRMDSGEDTIRRIYINIDVEFFSQE